uniref:Uncharacterized protein n=1 Tax=Entomoneis paludosa TaxID=265537 RepID=A0A7S2Y2Z3_9STRA
MIIVNTATTAPPSTAQSWFGGPSSHTAVHNPYQDHPQHQQSFLLGSPRRLLTTLTVIVLSALMITATLRQEGVEPAPESIAHWISNNHQAWSSYHDPSARQGKLRRKPPTFTLPSSLSQFWSKTTMMGAADYVVQHMGYRPEKKKTNQPARAQQKRQAASERGVLQRSYHGPLSSNINNNTNAQTEQ